jgi:hypothetical protein
MVSVKVTEHAPFNATQTIGGRITKDTSANVSVYWALPRLDDSGLMFTFEESDREALLSVNESQLLLAAKTTGEPITTHAELEALLLPKKKAKKTTKPKTKTTKTKPESSEKEE